MTDCPTSQSRCIDYSHFSASVAWTRPQALDNSGENPTIVCNKEPGSDFGTGASDVFCHAIDSAGNQATCEFTVQVKGNENNDLRRYCTPDQF